MQHLVLLNSSRPGLVLFCKSSAEVEKHPPDGPSGLKPCIFGSQHQNPVLLTLEIGAGPSPVR